MQSVQKMPDDSSPARHPALLIGMLPIRTSRSIVLQLRDLSNGSGVNPRHYSLADKVQVKACFVSSFQCFGVYQRS